MTDEQQYSYVMGSYWSNFIANGNPNDNAGNALGAQAQQMPSYTGQPQTYEWIQWYVVVKYIVRRVVTEPHR